MNEYRMTRPDVYTADCPGRTKPRERQGYYIHATDDSSAHGQMRRRFPEDSRFDCELWKENVAQ